MGHDRSGCWAIASVTRVRPTAALGNLDCLLADGFAPDALCLSGLRRSAKEWWLERVMNFDLVRLS